MSRTYRRDHKDWYRPRKWNSRQLYNEHKAFFERIR